MGAGWPPQAGVIGAGGGKHAAADRLQPATTACLTRSFVWGHEQHNNAHQKALAQQTTDESMHEGTVSKLGAEKHDDVVMLESVLGHVASIEALHAEVEVLLLEEPPSSTWEPGIRRPTPPSLASGPG